MAEKQKKKGKGKFALLVIVVIIIIIIIAAVKGGGDSKTASNGETEKTSFSVGETATLKDVSVTLIGVTESAGSTYNKPADGNVFVLCEFNIENNSSKDITISSMMSFEAYADDYSTNVSLTALMEKGDKNQLDGTVAAGKKMTGVVGYEVPATWANLEINFTPDFWSTKDIKFIATK